MQGGAHMSRGFFPLDIISMMDPEKVAYVPIMQKQVLKKVY